MVAVVILVTSTECEVKWSQKGTLMFHNTQVLLNIAGLGLALLLG